MAAKKAKTKKKNAPSPAQLRARKKFAAMAKARAKAARAAKRAAAKTSRASVKSRKRGTTSQQATARKRATTKRNGLRDSLARAADRLSTRKFTVRAKDTDRAPIKKFKVRGRDADDALARWRHSADTGRFKEPSVTKNPTRKKAAAKRKRRNAEHRDAQHPIHVRDYWQGRRGYKSQWQRAHEAGQQGLFKMNPSPAAVKAHIKQLEKQLATVRKRIAQEWARLDKYGALWPQYQPGSAMYRGYQSKAKEAKHHALRLEGEARDIVKMIERAYKALEAAQPHRANPKRNAGGVSRLAKRRYKEFHGTPSKKAVRLYFPKGTRAKSGQMNALGDLSKVYVKGRAPITFQRGGAVLVQDSKTDQMHIATPEGRKYNLNHLKGKRRNPAEPFNLGEITRIDYITAKPHLGDAEESIYFHRMGEETGERPDAVLNEEGMILIDGGAYWIEPTGIHN
jgi:hypothetical protein